MYVMNVICQGLMLTVIVHCLLASNCRHVEYSESIERLHVMSQGVWLPLILILQSCEFVKAILEAQVTQICSVDILSLIPSILIFDPCVWSSMGMSIVKDQILDICIKLTTRSKTFIFQIWLLKLT